MREHSVLSETARLYVLRSLDMELQVQQFPVGRKQAEQTGGLCACKLCRIYADMRVLPLPGQDVSSRAVERY